MGIGTNTPTQKLDVNGNIRIRGGQPGEGKYLKTDNLGNASWESLKGADLISEIDFPAPANVYGLSVIPSTGNNFAVQDNLLAIVDNSIDMLLLYDISDPFSPDSISSKPIGASPSAVDIHGNYIYVIDTGTDDLKIIEISDPANPTIVSNTAIGGFPQDIIVDDIYAYIIDQTSDDLKIIKISDPVSPTLTGVLALGTRPFDLEIRNDFAYIVDFDLGDLKIINISDPDSPVLTGNLLIGAGLIKIDLTGNLAYVIAQNNSFFKSIDITNHAAPVLVHTFNFFTQISAIQVQGNHVYFYAPTSGEFNVYDVSIPTSPEFVTLFLEGQNVSEFQIHGSIGYYISPSSDELSLINLTDPVALTVDAEGNISSESPAWIKSSSNLHRLGNGRVSIGNGTLAPDGKFHVNANFAESTAIYAKSYVPSGIGVFGENSGASGFGVHGKSTSASGGSGIFGEATGTTGSIYGVRGKVYTASAFAGYFEGGKNYFQGNVGIGTETPSTKLEVSSSGLVTSRITSTTAEEVRLDFMRSGAGSTDWRMKLNAGVMIFGTSANDLATTTDHFQFSASRFSPAVDNTLSLGASGLRWTTVYASNGVINTSDARQKTNINDIPYGIDEIMQLRPVSFQWKNDTDQGTKLGLLAQDLQPVIPEVVLDWEYKENESGERTKVPSEVLGVYYSDLIPVLIKGLQEQQEMIQQQQLTIDNQRLSIEQLRKELEDIRSLIDTN